MNLKRLIPLALILALHPAQAEEPSNTAESTGDSQASDTPSSVAARPPLPEASELVQQTLQVRLPETEQQSLQAGDETFLALWQPANQAEAAGLVILLPGDGESADWPQAIGPLRRKLPEAGWHTLSLSLPDPQPAPLPAAVLPLAPPPATTSSEQTPPAEQASETETETETEASQAVTPPATPQQLPADRRLARLDAALAFARAQQAPRIVLLGQRSGAYWASRYLVERQDAKDITQLVLISAQDVPAETLTLQALLSQLDLPSGDFYYKDDLAARQAAIARQRDARREGKARYTQIALKALPGNPEVEQEQLFRRLKGWLTLQVQ